MTTLGVETVTAEPRCDETVEAKPRLESISMRVEALTPAPVVVIVIVNWLEERSVNLRALEGRLVDVILVSAASTALRTVSIVTERRRRAPS